MTEEKNILLVEDNQDDAELIMLALKSKRIVNNIHWISDGEEALKYIELVKDNKKELPVLILLDLKMPKVNGLEVLRKIKSQTKTSLIPVVIFTSSNEESDMIQSYSNGANSYIQKPVIGEEFDGVIEKLGLYWLIINQVPNK